MRPQFHFTAERGWINDPHGITATDTGYHLFYQHVPDSMVWGPNCHWGHASGPDLFTLAHEQVALAPGEGDEGIWTGSLVLGVDGARILYTSTVSPDLGMGRIRTAVPHDASWQTWDKVPGVLLEAPSDLDVVAYRDPFVFRDGQGWRMFVGAGLRNGTAAAIGYTSTDLTSWSYTGVAASRSTDERDPVWTGAMWECPQLFEIDGQYVLISSIWENDVLHYAAYGVGTFAGGKFVARTWGQLTFGRSYYAPSFFRDAAGRPCLTFWMRGVRDDEAGWSSAHSVAHVLTLDGDRLIAAPHPDLAHYSSDPLPLGEPLSGSAAIIDWDPAAGGDQLTVRHGGLQTLRIDAGPGLLVAFSGLDPAAMPYDGGHIRIVLDGPTVEISSKTGLLGAPIPATPAQITIESRTSPAVVRPLTR